ncbi:MAG: hypothetical protein OEX12_00040 [Gammaproteobacteria bacterium]|nr:hypothetical protein [Gammaproteobacteria bacterium]
MNNDGTNIQPRDGGTSAGKKLIANSRRSRARLEELDFDPLEKQVMLYRRLVKEDEWWENLKAGTSVVDVDADGKKKKTLRYSGIAHAAILAQMQKIGNDLMRYGYGRVPENVGSGLEAPPPLQIGLTGSKAQGALQSIVIDVSPKVINDDED